MYDFKKIEQKWQAYWDKHKVFRAVTGSKKPKYYVLIEFPYPSGAGLHMGHLRSYTALDSLARKRRMEGYNVLFPIGYDAFGLPAENYAIKNKIHPKVAVAKNINVFRSQLKSLGFSFDWDRELATTDPEYVKWTQWQFLKFYEHGLAYKDKIMINWCTSCKTGLANEEIEQGKCERCGGIIERREKEQWMLKMKSYADKLIEGLKETSFIEKVKNAQTNWIGKSDGAEIDFEITLEEANYIIVHGCFSKESKGKLDPKANIYNKQWLKWLKERLNERHINCDLPSMPKPWAPDYDEWKKVFKQYKLNEHTTLIGHSCGASFLVRYLSEYKIKIDKLILVAPWKFSEEKLKKDFYDYEIDKTLKTRIKQIIIFTADNEGLEGKESVNLFRQALGGELIELKGKGHYTLLDMKTDEFPELLDKLIPKLKVFTTRADTIFGVTFMAISPEHPLLNKYQSLITNFNKIKTYQQSASSKSDFERLELNKEKSGLEIKGLKVINPLSKERIPIFVADYIMMNYGTGAIMGVPAHDERDYQFAKKYNLAIKQVIAPFNFDKEEDFYLGEGVMINSSFLNGISNQAQALDKVIKYLETHKIGLKKINYRLQDWVFSRQRFWGEPIPMIYCDYCGWVAVKEKDLPVLLPDIPYYEPTDDGESPLANLPKWYTVSCPKCGKKAKRETDTMPNWAGSSWYWLRYMDPHNKDAFASFKSLKYWGMVDWYNGGMEHATRHLLYARFWHRFLYDIGLVPTKEPFKFRSAHGMLLGEDGRKMSKSLGNIINPNQVIKEYGVDALRVYQAFMGDYEMDTAWSTNGLKGCKRFLDRVWKIQTKVKQGNQLSPSLKQLLHQTIKKVDHDIESMKYNTAISSLMILLNEMEKQAYINQADLRVLISLLHPFAPHLTEEINDLQQLGNILANSKWPKYDQKALIKEDYQLIIQVNGKVRGKEIVNLSLDDEVLKSLALKNDNVKKFIQDKKIIKMIIVPKKLINIVVKK